MAKWHVAPLRFAPAFRVLGVCEHSWLRYNNKLNNINCTKCRVSFLYKMSGFVFVRNVWFRFCTKCLVLVFVRDVVRTKCVYELSCPRKKSIFSSSLSVNLSKIKPYRTPEWNEKLSNYIACIQAAEIIEKKHFEWKDEVQTNWSKNSMTERYWSQSAEKRHRRYFRNVIKTRSSYFSQNVHSNIYQN